MSDTSPGEGWWLASDGRWYPPESVPAPPAPDPAAPRPPDPAAPPRVAPDPPLRSEPMPVPSAAYVATIGDIGITETLVVTPDGTTPLAGSQWVVADFTHTDTRIPTWAIVLAIVFAMACLLGLLFLLVKETTTTGYLEVSVRGEGLYHVTRLPIADQAQALRYRDTVAWAQGQAARA